jgi:hypothetical protein
MYIGLFILGNIAFWATSFLDYKSSMNQVSHGLGEKDLLKLNRDEYGYFSGSKFWMWHLIYWAVWTVLALLLYFLASDPKDKNLIMLFMALIGYFPASIAFFITYLKNSKKERVNRAKQVDILRILSTQSELNPDFVARLFSGQFWKERNNGRIRAILFPWWYLDGGDDFTFQDKFYKALYDRAHQPEANWFSDTKLQSL